MNKADKPDIIIVYGDNNKVSFGGRPKFSVAIVTIIIVAIAVLAISQCCPELLAEFLKWIIQHSD